MTGASREEANAVLNYEPRDFPQKDNENGELKSGSVLRKRWNHLKPPTGQVNLLLSLTLLASLTYGLLVSVTPRLSLPLPHNQTSSASAETFKDGSIFLLYLIFICCLAVGFLTKKLKLPELLGMLLVGILIRNLPLSLWDSVEKSWVGLLRKSAFVVILTQGGLGLDVGALRRLKAVVLRLSFLPCIAEAVTVGISAHLILGLPWIPGFLMGFMLGAVSPAVCVPSMLSLQEKGLGVEEGIPTLVIAASSTDDVLAITGFSILLSVAFSQGGIAMTIIKGPLDMLIGIIYGVAMGWIAWYFPEPSSEHCSLLRYCIILAIGLVSMFGSGALGFDGAGALGSLVASTVAMSRWSQNSDTTKLIEAISITWILFQPFLFGLIGGEIDLHAIDLEKVLLSLVILLLGLIIRVIVAFFAVMGENFTVKDRVFIALAWLPKATVQAALGSIYYDTVLQGHNQDTTKEDIGIQILTMAVLGILLTAPLGAVLISVSGPLLLKQSSNASKKEAHIHDVNSASDLTTNM